MQHLRCPKCVSYFFQPTRPPAFPDWALASAKVLWSTACQALKAGAGSGPKPPNGTESRNNKVLHPNSGVLNARTVVVHQVSRSQEISTSSPRRRSLSRLPSNDHARPSCSRGSIFTALRSRRGHVCRGRFSICFGRYWPSSTRVMSCINVSLLRIPSWKKF